MSERASRACSIFVPRVLVCMLVYNTRCVSYVKLISAVNILPIYTCVMSRFLTEIGLRRWQQQHIMYDRASDKM